MNKIKTLAVILLLLSMVSSCHSQQKLEVGNHPNDSRHNVTYTSKDEITLPQRILPVQVDSAFIVVNYFVDSTLHIYGANLAMARLYSNGELWRSHTDPSTKPSNTESYGPIFNKLLEEVVQEVDLKITSAGKGPINMQPFIYGLPIRLPFKL